jgi:hypothetical protein
MATHLENIQLRTAQGILDFDYIRYEDGSVRLLSCEKLSEEDLYA